MLPIILSIHIHLPREDLTMIHSRIPNYYIRGVRIMKSRWSRVWRDR